MNPHSQCDICGQTFGEDSPEVGVSIAWHINTTGHRSFSQYVSPEERDASDRMIAAHLDAMLAREERNAY